MRLGVVLVLVLAAASFASISATPTDADFQAAADQLDSFFKVWIDEGNIDKAMEYFHEDAFNPRVRDSYEQGTEPATVREDIRTFLEEFRAEVETTGGLVWQHPPEDEMQEVMGEEEVRVRSAYNAAFFVPSETFLEEFPPYLVAKISEGDAALVAVLTFGVKGNPDNTEGYFLAIMRRQAGTWKIIYLDF